MIQIYQSQELGRELADIIDRAEHTLRVCIYQLSPDATTSTIVMKRLWQALRAAPGRGIKCSAIIGSSLMAAPGTMSADRARQALEDAGWLAVCSRSARVMHAKTCTIDGLLTLIGSHNWTGAALSANVETSVLIRDPDTAAAIAKDHDKRLAEFIASDSITAEIYRRWTVSRI